MIPDDEMRGLIGQAVTGDRLEFTFKPGFGTEHVLEAQVVEALRKLGLRHNSSELKFDAGDGERLWSAIRNRSFGAGNSRTFTVTVTKQFPRIEFADAVYGELQELLLRRRPKPQKSIKTGDIPGSWWLALGVLGALLLVDDLVKVAVHWFRILF